MKKINLKLFFIPLLFTFLWGCQYLKKPNFSEATEVTKRGLASIVLLKPDCSTKRTDITPLREENLNQMTPWALVMSLEPESLKLLINVCGKKTEASQQKSCLNDVLSDNSFRFTDEDRIILSHINNNFDSLKGILWKYEQEVNRCKRYYYTYNSKGFCVPYTGKKCLDNRATIGYRSGIGGPRQCEYFRERVFLTPKGEIKTEFYSGANCRK